MEEIVYIIGKPTNFFYEGSLKWGWTPEHIKIHVLRYLSSFRKISEIVFTEEEARDKIDQIPVVYQTNKLKTLQSRKSRTAYKIKIKYNPQAIPILLEFQEIYVNFNTTITLVPQQTKYPMDKLIGKSIPLKLYSYSPKALRWYWLLYSKRLVQLDIVIRLKIAKFIC